MGDNNTRTMEEKQPYEVGDRVRVTIPNAEDFDYRHHGKHGTVENVLRDDLDVFLEQTRQATLALFYDGDSQDDATVIMWSL